MRFETIAFKAKLAGMGEDGRAVTFHVLVEPDAGAGLERPGPRHDQLFELPEAALVIDAIRDEAAARQRLAADVLARHAFSRHPNGHHIWIPLPRNWSRTEFTSHVQRQGLAIVTAETFSVEENQPHAIRVSLGVASSGSELVRALEILAAALKSSAARTRVV